MFFQDPIGILESAGAVHRNSHFVYASLRHGEDYINLDPIFTYPKSVAALLEPILVPPDTSPWEAAYDVVAAPATGGTYLVGAVGQILATRKGGYRTVRTVWADKISKRRFAFERAGFAEAVEGRRVLVVEDILTTGNSVAKVCRLIEKHGGDVVAVAGIVNRGGVTAEDLQVPELRFGAAVDFPSWEADECPHCASRRPIVANLGHADVFLADNPEWQENVIHV